MTKPKQPTKRGGAGRGQGRKSLSGAGVSGVIRLRADPELVAAVAEMGPDWHRDVLREAVRKAK